MESPLMVVIDRDGYEWLDTRAPEYLQAVVKELDDGKTPDEIGRSVLRYGGDDRRALAMRCTQAARHIARMSGGLR
jgi:hypothetical protein